MKQTYKVAIGDVKIGKKLTIAVEVKGDLTDEQKLNLMQFANTAGFITIASAQKDIDDYEEAPRHQGISYKIGGDGMPNVDPNQVTFDDIKTVTVEEAKKMLDFEGERLQEEEQISETGEQPEQPTEPTEPTEPEEQTEVEEVSAQALKAFTFKGKKLKKNEITRMTKSEAEALDGIVKIVDSSLPF